MRYGMVNAWMHEAHFFKFWLQKTILHALLDYMSKANMNITLPLSKFQRRGHKVTFHALQGLHQLYWGTLWCLWRSDWSFEVSMKACSDCEGKKGRGVGGHGSGTKGHFLQDLYWWNSAQVGLLIEGKSFDRYFCVERRNPRIVWMFGKGIV